MVSTEMMIQGRIFAINPPAFTGLLGLNRLAVSVANWQSGAGPAHAAIPATASSTPAKTLFSVSRPDVTSKQGCSRVGSERGKPAFQSPLIKI
jgi:hypothetical protein